MPETKTETFERVYKKLKPEIDAAPKENQVFMFLEIVKQVDPDCTMLLTGDFITITFTDGTVYNLATN